MIDNKDVPHAGDVEVLAWIIQYQSVLPGITGQRLVQLNNPEPCSGTITELVDRAHFTRLTAERDGVIVEVEHYSRKIEQMESELTKARELIADVVATGGEVSRAGLKRYADYLAHNVDESCGQDAEAAKD